MNKKLSLVAFVNAVPGREGELKELLRSLVAASRAEAGCINYDAHQSRDDPTVFVMYENWTDRSALDLHFGMPYMLEAMKVLPGLLRSPVEIHYLDMVSTPA